ncbi:MAG: hypothetical protein KJ620_09690, partial [Candidatus Edwardsbacteria bacterium]|nr:hypothetical protein [Candidatus Edwardsbacteria bacterium]
MKNLIVIVTTIFLLNSVCYSKGSKIIKQTEVDKFKETFTYGSYKEKKEALNDIHLVDKTVAFDIIKLELENYKWLNLREEVTEKLIYIDIERTTPLVWKYLGDSIYNRRLEILSGIARANNKKLINTVDKYRPKNIKEK